MTAEWLKKGLGVFTLIVVIGCFNEAWSQSREASSYVLDMTIPQVITPSRFSQRLNESPSAVTIIDRAMINASGARNLIDLMRLVPGFYVGYKNNALPSAAYHGFADEFARRSLLLVDGQRIFQYSRGIIEWNNIPLQLEDVERIEVIRGPNAAVYGSNAYQAVIDIQTRSPAESRGFYIRSGVGSRDATEGFARFGGRLGTMDYAVSLFRKGDSGDIGIPDDRSNSGVTFSGDWTVSPLDTLKLRLGYSRGEYRIRNTDSLPPEPNDDSREYHVLDNYQSLEWQRLLDPGTELSVTLAHNTFDYNDRGYQNRVLVPGLTLNLDAAFEEDRYNAEAKISSLVSNQWRYVAGLGYHYEALKAPYYFNSDDTLGNGVMRLFAHGEYRPSDRLIFNVGAMLERSEISAKDLLFLPRFSVHFHLNDHHTLRAIFSTGSRQPTLYENQSRAVIRALELPITAFRVIATGKDKGGLKPETIRSLELGYQWMASKNTHLDVRLYYERLSDLIVQFGRPGPPSPPPAPDFLVLDFDNENDLVVRGVETQLDWKNDRGLRIFARYAYTDIEADGARYNFGYERSAPRHSVGLLATQSLNHDWTASLNYHYQSKMQWYFNEPIDDYHKLDLRLAKRFKVGQSEAMAEVVGTNLLGAISDAVPDQERDRGVFFRFSLNY